MKIIRTNYHFSDPYVNWLYLYASARSFP